MIRVSHLYLRAVKISTQKIQNIEALQEIVKLWITIIDYQQPRDFYIFFFYDEICCKIIFIEELLFKLQSCN
jgi:hypothetical protein